MSGSIRKRPDGALDAGLAYTTVMTVLTRLWKKGLAIRVEQDRAIVYRAVRNESQLATRRGSKLR